MKNMYDLCLYQCVALINATIDYSTHNTRYLSVQSVVLANYLICQSLSQLQNGVY